MDHVIVRTKLQATIARRMVEQGLIRRPVHLVQLCKHLRESSSSDVSHQLNKFGDLASKITALNKARIGSLGIALYFLYLLCRSRLGGGRVYLANINWHPFALALKLWPGQRIYTFDDGSANVQDRINSFLTETPSHIKGMRGWLARMLFPRGPSHFVRSRIVRHCTIYAGLRNVVPREQLDVIDINWGTMVDPEDASLLPKNVRTIFLGSVYHEMNMRMALPVTADDVQQMIGWADLHIPHPRQNAVPRDPIMVKYCAEALIGYLAQFNEVVVAHYNSSVALAFLDHPRVQLIDLLAVAPYEILEAES